MYPPKFCTFKKPTDPTYPAYLTPETNLVSKIDEINKRIIQLNMENIEKPEEESGESNMMCMHSYGIWHKGSGEEEIGRREHRWSSWFEKNDEKKLYLKHEWRAMALHRIQLYFINNNDF